jgi:hypothetical protein
MKSEEPSLVAQAPQSATPPSSVTPSSSTMAQSLFFNNDNFTSRLLAACQERQIPQDMHSLMMAVQNFQQQQQASSVKNDSASPASSSAEHQNAMSPANTPHTAVKSENASIGEQVRTSLPNLQYA